MPAQVIEFFFTHFSFDITIEDSAILKATWVAGTTNYLKVIVIWYGTRISKVPFLHYIFLYLLLPNLAQLNFLHIALTDADSIHFITGEKRTHQRVWKGGS